MTQPLNPIHPFLLLFALLAFTIATQASASSSSDPAVIRLLNANKAPEGVVFELVSWEEDTWQWAAPMITDLRNQLKQKFPGIDVAVVSHGKEQFQLTRTEAKKQPQAIAQLQALTDEGVNLHVCGAFSLWKDIPTTAYLDMVDVSPSGPAQVKDYIKLGYTHILLEKPN